MTTARLPSDKRQSNYVIAFIKRQKERLQFTGWLQYIPIGILFLFFLLISGTTASLGLTTGAKISGMVSLGALLILLFDLATVKYHLHPAEKLPKRNDHLDLFTLLRTRVSCRSFQNRKLEPADFDQLISIVERDNVGITNQIDRSYPIRFEYVAAPLTVWPVVGASEFLVAIAPKKYSRRAIINVGYRLQKIVIAATRMGLATCWIGPGADQSSIVHHLGPRFDPVADHIICVCAVGYRSRYKPLFLRFVQLLQRRRLPLESLFFADSDTETLFENLNPINVDSPPYHLFGRTYEVCQWSPSSFNGQTTRCVVVSSDTESITESIERVDFYATTASRYYAPVALGIWCANWEMGCAALGRTGHFSILSADEKERKDRGQKLPRYDISWIANQRVT